MSDLTVGRLRSDAVRRVIKRAYQFNIPRQERFDLYEIRESFYGEES